MKVNKEVIEAVNQLRKISSLTKDVSQEKNNFNTDYGYWLEKISRTIANAASDLEYTELNGGYQNESD